jgi:hypothetical protein
VPAPARELSPDERRARVLRARRRMLTAVVLITAAGAATALLGVAPGWVIIPPVLMLAGSLVLLRDAAHSDAERAHRLAAQAHSSAEADGETDDAEREAAAAAAPASAEAPGGEFGEATAQVIDISARLADQLYDQYADAAERAVGD